MKRIIEKKLSGLEYDELVKYMQNCIEESIACLGGRTKKEYFEELAWYKDCEMEEYFTCWEEIWDENDDKVGEGLDTIAHKFVLNEDTRQDFEDAFEVARDNAYQNAIENLEMEDKIEVDIDKMIVYAYGYDEQDEAQVEIEMQEVVEKETFDEHYCYSVVGRADYCEGVWRAKLREYEKSSEEAFEIVMGKSKEQYRKEYYADQEPKLFDFEVEENYVNALKNFDKTQFRNVTSETNNLEDFMENSDFGTKAEIKGVIYYKVRDTRNNAYTIYFEDEELITL